MKSDPILLLSGQAKLLPVVSADAPPLERRLFIHNLARKKMERDLQASHFASPRDLLAFRDETRNILQEARILRSSRLDPSHSVPQVVFERAYCGEVPPEHLRILGAAKELRIATSCIAVGAGAVFARMIKEGRCNLAVDFSPVNGRSQMRALDLTGPSPDIFLAPDGACHFHPSAVIDEYEMLSPCFFEDQFILRRKDYRFREGAKIMVFPESSAALMFRPYEREIVGVCGGTRLKTPDGARRFRMRSEISRSLTRMIPLEVEAHDLPTIASQLDISELIIAWQPLASGLLERNREQRASRLLNIPELEAYPESWFPVTFSLYVKKKLLRQHRRLVMAFFEAFIADWIFCSKMPEAAWSTLENDTRFDAFLTDFSIGAGCALPFPVAFVPTNAKTTPEDGKHIVVSGPRTHRNSFYKAGDRWVLNFEDQKEVYLNNRTGLRYLATLLANPEKAFRCSELAAMQGRAVVEGQMRGENDGETPQQMKKRLNGMKELLLSGGLKPDDSLQVRDESERLERLLRLCRYGQGTARSPDGERIRKAVCNPIKREITFLKKNPATRRIGEHLAAQVVTGDSCEYPRDKGKGVEWQVENS